MTLARFDYDIFLQDDTLTFLPFFLAAREVWDWSARRADETLSEDEPYGYLTVIPLLEHLPYPVQVDLLAQVWAKHRSPIVFEGSLLDAAVFFAACEHAANLIVEQPAFVRVQLAQSIRRRSRPLSDKTAEDLRLRYEAWWDDADFLLLPDFEGHSPVLVEAIKQRLGIADEAIAPLNHARELTQPSRWIGTNLQGLLNRAEIEFVCKAVGLEVAEAEE